MMYRVILPQRMAVEEPVRPIKDEVFADQKEDHLRHQRQRGKGTVAVPVNWIFVFGLIWPSSAQQAKSGICTTRGLTFMRSRLVPLCGVG
jgi:hypothetical protein